MTDGERKLWSALRRKSLGVRFRPQFPIGPYTLDFYALRVLLDIEIDGDHHVFRPEKDAVRDAYLHELGIETMRFSSWDVADEFQVVMNAIALRVEQKLSSLK